MTSRELRKQRREAERKARKLEYRQNRLAATASVQHCGAGSPAGEPVAGPALVSTGPAPIPNASARLEPDEPAFFSEAKTPKRSGGPRTAHGKVASSANSFKHGLASGRVIIPGEDPAAFEALLADLLAEHAPANETEGLVVHQMAQSWWLMQRAIRIQNQAFTDTRIDTHKLALFMRYQTTHERAFYKALNALTKLKRSRDREGAVSSRRKSDPQFVSQGRRQPRPASEFVSQDSPFVWQNTPSELGRSSLGQVELGFVSSPHRQAA